MSYSILCTVVHCCTKLYIVVHCCTMVHFCTRLYITLQSCTQVFKVVQGQTILHTAYGCTLLYKVVHCCLILYKVVQGQLQQVVQSSRLYKFVHVCTIFYKAVQTWTQLHTVVQVHTRLYQVLKCCCETVMYMVVNCYVKRVP